VTISRQRTHVSIVLTMVVTIAADAHGQDRLSGNWQGYWTVAGDTMPVTMEVQYQAQTGRYTATFTADRLRVGGIPFNEVRVEGCCAVTMILRGDRTTSTFTGRVANDSLTGVLVEGANEGRFAYARAPRQAATYEERDLTFSSGDVTLAGTLLMPRTGASVPAVVFLHGSGAEGRWASRYLATVLVKAGIAALIFDKRGVGGSSGDWRLAMPNDLAADGAAAVARLQQEPRIDKQRIGIHGHSQGGTLAPLVAAKASNVAFIIGSAAAGVPTDSTEIFSILNSILRSAQTASDSASARAYTREVVAVAYHGKPRTELDVLVTALRDRPWFFAPPPNNAPYWAFSKAFGAYRPLEWWAQVRAPVLLVYGGSDERVPAAESAEHIAATLRRAGNSDVTVRIFPGADHNFRLAPGPSGWPVSAPDYVSTLVSWLSRFRR